MAEKIRKLFKSSVTKKADGWPMGFYGNSQTDGEGYALDTHYLKSDEIPEVMMDSKTATEFIAGLLNAYFNDVNVVEMPTEKICVMGVIDETRTGIYENPNQKEIEF